MMDNNSLNNLIISAKSDLEAGQSTYDLRIKYLGKNSEIFKSFKLLPSLSSDEKKEFGPLLNSIKANLELLLQEDVKTSKISQDYTAPLKVHKHGHSHPTDYTMALMINIFSKLGFKVFETPEIEDENDNFSFLRVAKDHPARDMQDTFWTTDEKVLRTQTTAFQRRALEQFKPPFAVIQAGKVFRAESEDATHLSELNMLDGFAIGTDLNFTHLKGVLYNFLRQLFGNDVKVRFRPSFFPFVEPGAEMDMMCLKCKGSGCKACGNSGWLEIIGCGITHPEIIESAGLDPNIYHGIAFGIGVERIAMRMFEMDDIRELVKNNPEFLEQLT
jgi:phenylalanyl-tRNA synthetase alpha chain